MSKIYLCRLHPDFHMPADVDVGAGFDGMAYAQRLKANGVDAVAFFAKCHYGHSYYYITVGYRHPRLQCDMLAEVVRGCRAEGLGIVVYFSVFLDTAAVTHHSDWALRAATSATDAGFDSGNFLPVCVNSPYLEELFIPQSIEVVTKYDVDEVFYDTMTGFQPCYCPHCQARFGHPIPHGSDDPRWLEYVAWYRACYDHFYAATARAVHEANPRVGIIFNWEWGVRRPVDPPPHITRLAADLIPTGTVASALTHYFAGSGYPSDYMCGRFLHGLGDWNNSTPQTVTYTAAATITNGGSFYIIDRQLPDGRLEERAYAMMRTVFEFVRARREVVEGTAHVPETAVLLSHDHLMGDKLHFFPDAAARKERSSPFEGASRMFMHHGRHYTAISTQTLARRAREYAVIILPETEYLDTATLDVLSAYVEQGGALLVTQAPAAAGLNSRLLELAGVEQHGFSDLNYTYFGAGPEPAAASGVCALVTPTHGAHEIVPLIAPRRAGKGGAKFGHGRAPAGAYEGHAAVTERRVGAGRVVYCAMPVFGEYWRAQNPYISALVFELLDRLLPRPLARVHTPAQVELVAVRKDDDLIVHLVNHSCREQLLGYWYPLIEYMPIVRDIAVEIRVNERRPCARFAPSGAPAQYDVENGYARVVIKELEFMESIVLQDYFHTLLSTTGSGKRCGHLVRMDRHDPQDRM